MPFNKYLLCSQLVQATHAIQYMPFRVLCGQRMTGYPFYPAQLLKAEVMSLL